MARPDAAETDAQRGGDAAVAPAGGLGDATPPSGEGRSGRRRLLAALGAAVAIAGVALFVLLTRGDVSALEAKRLVVDPIPVGAPPRGLATGDGTPWVLFGGEEFGTVRPIEDGRAGEAIRLDDEAYALAATGSDLWVTTEGGLARVDATTRETVGGPVVLEAGSDSRIAAGEGALWVTDTIDQAVVRADPVTGRAVGDPIPVGGNMRAPIVAGEGAVWVMIADVTDDHLSVVPIDPATNRAGKPIEVGAFSNVDAIAVGAGGVWVADSQAGRVRRIDAAKRELDRRSVVVEGGVADVAFGSGAVWALDADGLTVVRIDPETMKVVGQPLAVAAGSESRLAVSPGAAWVLSNRRESALRISWDD